jgi:NADH-quinone oxidoreductase subunit K
VTAAVPVSHVLLLAILLFGIGLAGLLSRRNTLFMLLCIEIMLNATGLLFIAGGARWDRPDGQVMFLFILATAAAEVAVGLALVLRLHRQHGTIDADAASEMNG